MNRNNLRQISNDPDALVPRMRFVPFSPATCTAHYHTPHALSGQHRRSRQFLRASASFESLNVRPTEKVKQQQQSNGSCTALTDYSGEMYELYLTPDAGRKTDPISVSAISSFPDLLNPYLSMGQPSTPSPSQGYFHHE